MFLRFVFCGLLLFFALLLPTAAYPSFAYTPNKHQVQNPTDNAGVGSSLSAVRLQQDSEGPEKYTSLPGYDQRPDITVHGKDDLEREKSLCEAGIVSACRTSIEAAKAESDFFAPNDGSHRKTQFAYDWRS